LPPGLSFGLKYHLTTTVIITYKKGLQWQINEPKHRNSSLFGWFTLSCKLNKKIMFYTVVYTVFRSHYLYIPFGEKMMSSPAVNFINVNRACFSYEHLFSSYVLALNKFLYEKFARLTMMKLSPDLSTFPSIMITSSSSWAALVSKLFDLHKNYLHFLKQFLLCIVK